MKNSNNLFTPQLIIAIGLVIALVFLSMSSWGDASPVGETVENKETSISELIFSADDKLHPALLLNTEVHTQVNGLLATVSIKQTFKNESSDWVNGKYTFPLPSNAAIDELTFSVGDRVIKGVIKEKQAAKKAFEKAQSEGKKAALMEQQRPNLFSMNIANIPPSTEVVTHITYVEIAKFDNGQFSLRLPTTLTPRYIAGKDIPLDSKEQKKIALDPHSGWAKNTDRVTDANKVTPPQTHEAPANSHQFTLSMEINAGISIDEITSETHNLVSHLNGDNYHVSLANVKEPLDRDLVIVWSPSQKDSPSAAAFSQKIDNDYYTMLFLVPPAKALKHKQARNMTFIIDSSGSMSGASMPQAKNSLIKALSYLSDQDTFNIIDFDNDANALFSSSEVADVNNITTAVNFIKNLEADGGTNMQAALDMAFDKLKNKSGDKETEGKRLEQIVFMTDGSVSDEEELFRSINSNLGNARLFTVGIGSAPNSFFMKKAAQFGRGTYTFINDLNQVEEKMTDLFEKIQTPVITDISVQWPAGSKPDVYPQKTPDLYRGEPIILVAKSDRAIDEVSINGRFVNHPWSRNINLPNAYHIENTDNIDSVWGRRKIEFYMDQLTEGKIDAAKAKGLIVPLAIDHHLMSKYTSFVAIDTKVSRPKNVASKKNTVPNLMPNGSTMDAPIPYPSTATNAELFTYIGLFLLMMSLLSQLQGVRSRALSFVSFNFNRSV